MKPGRHVLGFCHEVCALAVVKPAPCPPILHSLLLLAAVLEVSLGGGQIKKVLIS